MADNYKQLKKPTRLENLGRAVDIAPPINPPEDMGVDPAKHDCSKELCTGCGIYYMEIPIKESNEMHHYQDRVGDPICLCGTCRSNILAKEKKIIFEGFIERLWGALWKDHSTPNTTFSSIECHLAKRELLMDVQELARQYLIGV